MSAPVVVMGVLVSMALGAGVAWWLQDARVEAKEQQRAAAATELAALASRVQNAEASAEAAAIELRKAQAVAESSTKQAGDLSGQLEAARKDASAVRTERDEARAAVAAGKAEIDRMRAADLDPGALPATDLRSLFGGTTQYRTRVDYRLSGSTAIPGLDKAETDKMLAAAMQGAGLSSVTQGTFRIAAFVTVGRDKPRAIGVMMLVLRTLKVPGESGSREVAVWGQQRTSCAADAEVAGQVRGLLDELCREFATEAGVRSAAAGSGTASSPPVPPGAIPPAPAPANAPNP